MISRGWPLLLEGASALCELADRALAEELAETGGVIMQRARELLERGALELQIELGLGPRGDSDVGRRAYADLASTAIARLGGLEVRLRALERFVETSRRDAALRSMS
jgi:hypothetical protein